MIVGSSLVELDGLMTRFAVRVPGVSHAIAVIDGLVVGRSSDLPRDRADAAAAVTSGLVSLSSRSARLLGGGNVIQTLVEMDGGFLFLMAGGGGSAVVAWAESSCDVGLVGYELAGLADQVGSAPAQPGPWYERRL